MGFDSSIYYRRDAARWLRQVAVFVVVPFFFHQRATALALRSSTDSSTSVRDVRVLIASGQQRVRFHSDAPIFVLDSDQELLGTLPADTTVVAVRAGRDRVRLAEGIPPRRELILSSESGAIGVSVLDDGKWLQGYSYAGTMRVMVNDRGAIDVVNNVHIESYVASVVAGEVWPTFATEAYRAQAIVVRTFVLYQMKRRNAASFDVKATQRAQVYRGLRDDETGRRATEAAAHTRGLACTWRENEKDRLLCAYYSAACGGMSQSAAIFGSDSDVNPLSGGISCDYCKIGPTGTYRWAPVRLKERLVRSRLLARYPEMKSVGRISKIEVIERTPAGRPIKLRIVGSGRKSFDLLAERFRLAIDGGVIRSTDCKVRVDGDEVIFSDGRGFGHGLGLCQWGMEGQARQGKKAGAILRYYFPGTRLTKVY